MRALCCAMRTSSPAFPGCLIQGRLDLAGPLVTAWALDRAWPDAELIVVDNAGHSAGDTGMTEAIVSATERFKKSCREDFSP